MKEDVQSDYMCRDLQEGRENNWKHWGVYCREIRPQITENKNKAFFDFYTTAKLMSVKYMLI